jgi:hypothetical protein
MTIDEGRKGRPGEQFRVPGAESARSSAPLARRNASISSDTRAMRQFDTNELYSLPHLSRLFGSLIWIVRRCHVALQHLLTYM